MPEARFSLLSAAAFSNCPWRGRRVTVMGLGRHGGGVAATRYLAELGARITISDLASHELLADSLAELADVPLAAVHLGRHEPDDLHQADVVVVNPAVRPSHPLLAAARRRGAQLTSETELFLRTCPAHLIGVTGSNGKSTTCAMLAAVLGRSARRVWLGGNIGHSLLADLDEISPDDWVVLELSSFQLAHLNVGVPLPRWSIVTGCTPNHLDWHTDFNDYRRAKQRLVHEQPPGGVSVWDADDSELAVWANGYRGEWLPPWPTDQLPTLRVPGEHNRRNAARVAALTETLGMTRDAICSALAEFSGLPHRLELVAELQGRRFYDDSKATTPEAAVAALAAVEGPVWWLAGGVTKGAKFDAAARSVVKTVRGAALFGTAGKELQDGLRHANADCPTHLEERLDEALRWCWQQSRPGDAILLSPGCASLDQFRDFVHRGLEFRRFVSELATHPSA